MVIERTYDVENVVREALKPYFEIYCRPLPENFKVPSLLVTIVGGTDENTIDSIDIVIDSRAEHEVEAIEMLLDAVGVLNNVVKTQDTPIRYVVTNSICSWGKDISRPDLVMCSARLTIYLHKLTKEI